MTYRMLEATAWCCAKLSDRSLERISYFFAFVLYRIFRFRRSLVRENLRRIISFSNHSAYEIDRLGMESIQSLILTGLELLSSRYIPIAANTKSEGLDDARKSLLQGRGLYILSTHSGNWEALAALICQQLAPAYVPVKNVGGASLNQFVRELRNNYGLITVERKQKGDASAVIQSQIEKAHVVGFMHDQARPGSPKYDFFGVSAKTNVSMAAIWRKHPAPMIAAVAVRTSARHHTIHFYPELPLVKTDDAEQDLRDNTNLMNRVTEKLILTNLGQYLLMHDRWK